VKIPKLKLNQLYEIVWMDNNVPAKSGWMDKFDMDEFIEKNVGDLVQSSGYLYSRDKTFLVLHSCTSLGVYKSWMRVLKIYLSCIVSIHECNSKIIYEAKK